MLEGSDHLYFLSSDIIFKRLKAGPPSFSRPDGLLTDIFLVLGEVAFEPFNKIIWILIISLT